MASLERFSRQAYLCEHCLGILQKKGEPHSCPSIFATPEEQSQADPSLRAFRRGIFQAGPSFKVHLFMDPSRLSADTPDLQPVPQVIKAYECQNCYSLLNEIDAPHRCPSVQASEQARGNPTAELLTFLETLRRGAKIDVVRHTTTTLHQA